MNARKLEYVYTDGIPTFKFVEVVDRHAWAGAPVADHP